VEPIIIPYGHPAAHPREAPAVVPRQDRLFAERPAKLVAMPAARPQSKSTGSSRTPRSPRRPVAPDSQGSLDFVAQAHTRKTLGTTVEAMIFCEEPVATVWHRAIAAALDWSMVIIGYGLCVLLFHLMGGAFDLRNGTSLAAFGGMLAAIGFAYGAIWTLAGRDTPGMRWTQLQITTFDGYPPEPRHRLLRLAGSCLSLCTVVGLLWSLADEESLTWQDHISGTFPTPMPRSLQERRS